MDISEPGKLRKPQKVSEPTEGRQPKPPSEPKYISKPNIISEPNIRSNPVTRSELKQLSNPRNGSVLIKTLNKGRAEKGTLLGSFVCIEYYLESI